MHLIVSELVSTFSTRCIAKFDLIINKLMVGKVFFQFYLMRIYYDNIINFDAF